MRISFGFVATLCIIFGFFVIYVLVSPAWDMWYDAGLQVSASVAHPMTFLNWCWKLLPIEVIFVTVLWLIVAGMGEAANPGKLILGQIVIISGLVVMQVLYATCEPMFLSWMGQAPMYAGVFMPVTEVISTVWYNYCIPLFFGVLVWAVAISISTEAETRYGY